MSNFNWSPSVSEQTERVHISFLESEIDIATTFLCLAEHDIRAGNGTARAAELIRKAFLGHTTVVEELASLPNGVSEEEKRGLLENAAKLRDAMRTVERQFQVLLAAAPADGVKNHSGG